MAPSRDACLLCSCPFFAKQQFFRRESCSKRVHAKCVTWPDEELQHLKSGSRSFYCSLCDPSYAHGKPSEGDSVACRGEHSSTQTGSLPSCSPPDGDLAGLRHLLLDALEGISFLSDEVSQLREENERLRKDHSRGVEQQARVVASFGKRSASWSELLTNRTATVPVKAAVVPARENDDPSAISKPPAYSGQPLSNTLSPSNSPPAEEDTCKRRSVISATTSSAALLPPEGERKKKPASFGAMTTSIISVAERPQRPQRPQWPKAIFVKKLSPDTTAADIKKYITSMDLSPISFRRLQTNFQSYSSFYIEVDEETLQRLHDPLMWPLGCLFKPFRGVLRDHILHPSELVPSVKSAVLRRHILPEWS
ncbi:hypothetical protein MTO96_050155 [Rhipicephalus appendiculatus]